MATIFSVLFIFLWNVGVRASLFGLHSFLRRGSGEVSADLFCVVCSDKTQRNGWKLYQERFRMNTGGFFMAKRLLKHWNRLLREGADVQCLPAFKRHMDSALTIYLGQPWTGQAIGPDDHCRSFPTDIVLFYSILVCSYLELFFFSFF